MSPVPTIPTSTRIIFIKYKSPTITPLLKILSRFPIICRTEPRLLNMKNKSLHDLASAYLFKVISSPPSPLPACPLTPVHSMSTPNCLQFMVLNSLYAFILLYVIFLCKICCSSFFLPLKKRKKKLSISFKTRHYSGSFLNFSFYYPPEVAYFPYTVHLSNEHLLHYTLSSS